MKGMIVRVKVPGYVTAVILSQRERDTLLAALRLLQDAIGRDDVPWHIRSVAEDTQAPLMNDNELNVLADQLQGDNPDCTE